jgi:hypothetical protein
VQIITQPLPLQHLVNLQPRLPIRQRRKEQETPQQNRVNHRRRRPRSPQPLRRNGVPHRSPLDDGFRRRRRLLWYCDFVVGGGEGFDVEDEFDKGACDEGGCEMRREVVVQEELAAHDEEGEVVRCPGEEEEAR